MARIFELTTPLGADTLLFRSMHGREELGRLSEFEISAVSTRADIGPGDLLGKSVTVKVELRSSGGYRYFNGYVTRFSQGGMVGRYYQYSLTVAPWHWFLTRTTDCRIFQEKTVPEIIKEVFADHPVAVFEDGLTDKYVKREYCVQYRETDLAFVSRLMEEEGIYSYLDHGDGRHVLKLVDSYSGHKALENKATISYYAPHEQSHSDEEYISAWTFVQSIQPGAVALDDYDFTKPKADLAVKAKLVEPHEHADYEVFDYPGEYRETGNGDQYVRVRIDELHAEFDQAEAECNVREISVGHLFSLTNAPRRDQEREYLIVSAAYNLRDNAYESALTASADYSCSFTVLQSRQQFRPARATRRPTVRGPQTAVVVGPAGEEIWCDKYGRVKVQFHWDRYGKKNENSSCWIRVSHQWAGGAWGVIALPRIGQEVIVDFLEGDPDQPIITGRVYNADQMPPYALPGNKTQTGIKSRSSMGGGAANFNEIRLEDKKGSEQLYIHAEKNQDIEVENDETHWVGHDRIKTVGHDETTHVKHDRTETVDNNETITVHANRTETVDGEETVTVHKNETRSVSLNRTDTVVMNEARTVGIAQAQTVGAARNVAVGATQAHEIGINDTWAIGQNHDMTVGSSYTLQVGKDRSVKIDGSDSLNVGKDQGVKITNNQMVDVGADRTLKVGKKLLITAGDEVSIETGDAMIAMKKDGTIKIKGKNVTIEASGKITIKSDGKMTLKGSQILEN